MTNSFTALHRILGRQPGALTGEMLAKAIEEQLPETDDLDWKRDLPPLTGLSGTDFPKDVAAMANLGGGLLVFGVQEKDGRADSLFGVAEVSEQHEQALRSVAVTAISPPVFNLGIHRINVEGKRALIVEIHPSLDGPHLIYNKDFFGAPIRNGAHTVWMRERQIEQMYRARFDDQRQSQGALDSMYQELIESLVPEERAWATFVARHRQPIRTNHRSSSAARDVISEAERVGQRVWQQPGQTPWPLWHFSQRDLRSGLRRWSTVPSSKIDDGELSVHDDGGITLSNPISGQVDSFQDAVSSDRIQTGRLEKFVMSALSLLEACAGVHGPRDCDVIVGVEWSRSGPLSVEFGPLTIGADLKRPNPLKNFRPIKSTVTVGLGDEHLLEEIRSLALDVINQVGFDSLLTIPT
ncbi:MAG: ATP-binding protein [Propionibacteriaceae bacterium]|jgi:hypothetical protein|nr:ATP-binding protein [Propionibacteriaceae bacterium]